MSGGTVLAVDPGDSTGIALISGSGELLWHAICSYEELSHTLSTKVPHKGFLEALVVEDFALLPQKAQKVSAKHSRYVKAARGIGVCENFAYERGLEVHFRDPRHWRVGLQLAGISPSSKQWPKNHATGHDIVAYGVGFHWMVAEGLVEARMPD